MGDASAPKARTDAADEELAAREQHEDALRDGYWKEVQAKFGFSQSMAAVLACGEKDEAVVACLFENDGKADGKCSARVADSESCKRHVISMIGKHCKTSFEQLDQYTRQLQENPPKSRQRAQMNFEELMKRQLAVYHCLGESDPDLDAMQRRGLKLMGLDEEADDGDADEGYSRSRRPPGRGGPRSRHSPPRGRMRGGGGGDDDDDDEGFDNDYDDDPRYARRREAEVQARTRRMRRQHGPRRIPDFEEDDGDVTLNDLSIDELERSGTHAGGQQPYEMSGSAGKPPPKVGTDSKGWFSNWFQK